jgi:protease-4
MSLDDSLRSSGDGAVEASRRHGGEVAMRRVGCALLLVLLGLAIGSFFLSRAPDVEPGSALVIQLQGRYVEAAESPLLARLTREARRPFVGLLSELRKAERDERIGTVLFRVRGLEIGWAKAQELRGAIRALRDAGKRTLAYLELESFGANLEYFVASAADAVHVAPGTTAPLVGLAAEYLFLGGLWEKLGVGIEVERVGDYKTAADFFAGREMSDAHREMADALLDSIDAQFVGGIAEGRRLSPAQVREAIDAAPVRAEELLERKLIDGVSGFADVVEVLGDPPLVEEADYARVPASDVGFDPVARLALVYGSGTVVVGDRSSSPTGDPVLASDAVAEALEEVAEDDSIDAVVLRIDSPGGSALASDHVWQATQKVREGDKPLIVSMSDLAASGGYYVACGADFVFAGPGTLTGSIGVFVLRPVLRDLYEKLDVGVESLTRGAHADLLLGSRPLSEATRARLRDEVGSIYALFVERVADGRGLSPEQVDAVGRGRVWTGAQAVELGLVDGLGGLREAAARARMELELDPEADVEWIVYPKPRTLAEQIDDVLRGAAARAAGLYPGAELVRRLEPWWTLPANAPVLLPPFAVEIR